jgi:hypothetical protein
VLFSNPRNLEKITSPVMNFTIKNARPAEIYPGLMIENTVSPLLGILFTWLTEIVQADAPHRSSMNSGSVLTAPSTMNIGFALSGVAERKCTIWLLTCSASARSAANPRLDPAIKTALPNVSTTPERTRLWNSKISKPSSI